MDPEIQTPDNKKILGISVTSIIIIVIIVAGIVFFARDRLGIKPFTQQSTNDETSSVTTDVTGAMGLTIKGNANSFRKGDTITLLVFADSKGQEIIGYDIALRYDSTKLQYEGQKTLLNGADQFEASRDGVAEQESELYITGVQSTNRENPFQFNNTALTEVTFTALESGVTRVEFMYEPGNDSDSNLFTPRLQDILNTASGTDIEIQ